LTADDLEQRLRSAQPPIISRVAEGKVLLDLRTVAPADETDLVLALDTLAQ
jgi:seryl-tRNA(Sec) selenium transferase